MRIALKSRTIYLGSVIISLLILCGGWLWARIVISAFQRREGLESLGILGQSEHYAWWGLTVPRAFTAILLLISTVGTVVTLFRRRDYFLLVAYLAFGLALAMAFLFSFVSLDLEAFE